MVEQDTPLDAVFQGRLARLFSEEIARVRAEEQALYQHKISKLQQENQRLKEEIRTLRRGKVKVEEKRRNDVIDLLQKGTIVSEPVRILDSSQASDGPILVSDDPIQSSQPAKDITKSTRIKSEKRVRLSSRSSPESTKSPDKKPKTEPFKMKSFAGTSTLTRIPPLRSRSMIEEDFHLIPTQYSDDDNDFQPDTRSSPIKLSPIKDGTQYTDSSPTKEPHTPTKQISSKVTSPVSNSVSGGKIVKPENKGSEAFQVVFQEPQAVFQNRPGQFQEPKKVPQPKTRKAVPYCVPPTPQHTILQRREYVLKHYQELYYTTDNRVNLLQNPITEQMWIISDFRPNPSYVKRVEVDAGGGIVRKMALTRQEEENRRRFYKLADSGSDKVSEKLARASGRENFDSENGGKFSENMAQEIERDMDPESDASGSDSEIEDSQTRFEDHLSQMFDKFPSPPGFMVSEFPGTQEEARRRMVVEKRQQRRLQRRVQACVSVREGRQVGEFVFRHEVLNLYVESGRWDL